jgi:hypothetical protein
VNLQFSESFTNDAATAAGRFHSDARVATGTSANSTSLTIVYEAATRSYTISTAGRSQSFKPTDIDPVQTGSGITVFKKTSGSLTESLSLTDPGISGPLSYDYVGSGFWQRAKKNSASVDFTFDAFTYGVETVDASLPRTGVGLYSVELIGARAFGAPLAMAGQGTLQVNFLDGDISSRGQLATISLETNDVLSTGNYLATANLSSNGNSFAGTCSGGRRDLVFDGVGRAGHHRHVDGQGRSFHSGTQHQPAQSPIRPNIQCLLFGNILSIGRRQ